VTGREIFSIPFTRPEGIEISNMLDVYMRWGETLIWWVMGGMCMKVPPRKGFGGGGVFFRTGRRFLKLFYLLAHIFVYVCLSVCLISLEATG
jgi:hypothetical protein